MAYENASPDGTPTQQQILFQGQRAAVTIAIKTYANLANNQTLTLLENVAGVPTLVTFEVQKDGSFTPTGGAVVPIDLTGATDSATAWAAIVAFLNARPNAAYVWAINGTSDGLVGTAKSPGEDFNIPPTGTCLSGNGSVTTNGTESIVSDAAKLASISGGSWADNMLNTANKFLRVFGVSELTEFDSTELALYPYGLPTLPAAITDALGNGLYNVYPGAPIFTPVRFSGSILTNPATSRFCVAFRGIFPSPQSYPNITTFGVFNQAGTHFSWIYSYAPQSATNLSLQCAPVAGGGAVVTTSHVLDGLEHDYMLLGDGTNHHAIVDGVHVGSVSGAGGPTTPSTIVACCLRNGGTAPYLQVRRFGRGR